jgi:uncharacterized membrane protein
MYCDLGDRNVGFNGRIVAFCLLLTLVAAVVRVIGINDSMTIDEVFLMKSLITQNPVRIFFHPSGSAHIGHTLPANISVRLFGASVWAARLPALLFGVFSPLLLYFAVRRTLAGPAAAMAAVVLCFSPVHVWYSQEAKGNVPLVFFTILSWLALTHFSGDAKLRWVLLYIAALVGCGLSHLSGVFVILGQLAATVVYAVIGFRAGMPIRSRIENAGRWFGVHGAALYGVLLTYAPIAFFLAKQKEAVTGDEGSAGILWLLQGLTNLYLFLDGPRWAVFTIGGFAVFGFICLVVRAVGRGLDSRIKGSFLLLLLLPLLFSLAVTQLSGSFSHARYQYFVLPCVCVLVAQGVSTFSQLFASRFGRMAEIVCSGGLLVIYLAAASVPLSSFFRLEKSNYRAIAQWEKAGGLHAPVYILGSSKHSYPALAYTQYANDFFTDSEVDQLPDSCRVLLVVLDPLHAKASYPQLVAVLGDPVATFECLGELDQFRIRKSQIYEVDAEVIKRKIGVQP